MDGERMAMCTKQKGKMGEFAGWTCAGLRFVAICSLKRKNAPVVHRHLSVLQRHISRIEREFSVDRL